MSPEAASGLRPAAAYVLVAIVLMAVATRSVWIQVYAEGAQPEPQVTRVSPTPGFSIADRNGRALALSVECFDVTMSPRAMWRSHTPKRMARRIADVLRVADSTPSRVPGRGANAVRGRRGDFDLTENEVLARMMPRSLDEGIVPGRLVPHEPRLLVFDESDLAAVRHWLDTGATGERTPGMALRGLTLSLLPPGTQVDRDAPNRWTIEMEPVAALGVETRREQFHLPKTKAGRVRTAPPERWTRRLLGDLVALIGEERLLERMADRQREVATAGGKLERREHLRDAVWGELMPTRFRVIARGVDPVRAHALRDLLVAEGVSPWQVQLVARVERRHPTRPGGWPAPPDAELALVETDDAFRMLGHWGMLDEERADSRARRDRENRPHVLPWEDEADPFEAYRRSLIVEPKPWSGIELLCRTELEDGAWADIAEEVQGRTYTTRRRHVARDRRRAWEKGVPNYFIESADATDVPTIVTTIDAHLQEVVHAELGLMFEEQRPALAMAIVVDIETGDVLAFDTRTAYAYSGFAPLLHVFTPGSTFKAIIMAIALDVGATTPETRYETFAGTGLRLPGRTIREALGAPDQVSITASEGLALSCNAVLVQIALGIEASLLRGRILELGYGDFPGAGLGHERRGTVTPLKNGTWVRQQTHASVGFGHEIGVTLWQHAAGLATVLRGGVRRPLRLLRSIERDGYAWDREVEPGERVLAAQACSQVRTMMAMGAEIGTGRHVATAEANPEFEWLGTKTGTTEKVVSELCVHIELEALADFARRGARFRKSDRAALFALGKGHGRSTCYTSSMCAAGRVQTENGPREIMVLVVADDPTGTEKFGSLVTGPTTMAILRQAFGFERVLAEGAKGGTRRATAVEANSSRPLLYKGQRRPRPSGRGATGGAYDASWLTDDLPWDAPASTTDSPEDAR